MDAQSMLQGLAALEEAALIEVLKETLQGRPELAPGLVNSAVPDLTYAPADAIIKRRATGRLGSIQATGCGSIDCPELKAVFGHDIAVHKNQVGSLLPGTDKEMKPQAFDLQPTRPSHLGKGMGKARVHLNGGPLNAFVGAGFWSPAASRTPGLLRGAGKGSF
ncbi:unnamed protein product [Symbiodinium pilosum]|uniref:Uncharacterized protein n=1 Tax=Symbiodinium pilosum TaxID=2952 RepID=A0A812WZV7_SYMPI|nr:unnamed protein product [Symbiodinium pilosum]